MTINSAFGIPINLKDYTPLSGKRLKKFINNFENLKYIIIDEISMVSCQLLFWIDARLKQIMQNKLSFGGISVLICGDWGQIPPIGQNSL